VVSFKRAGASCVEYFPDGKEGAEVSRRRAIKYRDWLKARLPPWNKLHRRSANNTSGIIGVSRIVDRTRTGRRIPRWIAHWHTADGPQRKRSFSVLKYGARRAKRLAVEARRMGVEELLAGRANA
jgi:AP2 domain-containing protein